MVPCSSGVTVRRYIGKRSKPVRSAEAALTRFGSVLRGTNAPLRTPLLAAPLQDSSRRADTALWSETCGRSAPRLRRSICVGHHKNQRRTYSSGSARKRSACGWFIPARRRWRLPSHKREAVTASSHLASTRSAFRSLRSLQFSLVPSKRQLAVLVRHPQPLKGRTIARAATALRNGLKCCKSAS